MNHEEIKNKLIEALTECSFFETLKNEYGKKIDANTLLFDDLNFESIQLLEFIILVEKKLDRNIDFEKMDIQDFDSIDKLSHTLSTMYF